MKRIIITLVVSSLLIIPLFSQNVNIPDANFLTALIEEGVDTDEDGQISIEEAEAVTALDVSGISFFEKRNISNLTGIEAFKNLDSLAVSYNLLTSLDMSANAGISYLNCRINLLTSLDVSANLALKLLYCDNNELTDLDVSNNIDLEVLNCQYNALTGLDVTANTSIDTLWCFQNNISSLDVSKNLNLVSFWCFSNNLISIDVSKNLNIASLSVDFNQLSLLDISNNTALTELWCGSNNLTVLDISNNTLIGTDDSPDYDLEISNMPTLGEVCVWESFPAGVDYNAEGSDNICFQTDCNGDCSIGLDESSFSGFSFYPNPTSNLITIETDIPDCYSLEIHSLFGQLICKEEMEGNSKQIDMTPFNKGIYFVSVRSDAWVRTEKVVKY